MKLWAYVLLGAAAGGVFLGAAFAAVLFFSELLGWFLE